MKKMNALSDLFSGGDVCWMLACCVSMEIVKSDKNITLGPKFRQVNKLLGVKPKVVYAD